MTFYDFMMDTFHLDSLQDTPHSELAYDMYLDKNFPRKALKKWEIKDYLLRQGACQDCLDIFQQCWGMYKKGGLA